MIGTVACNLARKDDTVHPSWFQFAPSWNMDQCTTRLEENKINSGKNLERTNINSDSTYILLT